MERGSADARDATLPFPASLASLLAAFGPVFTAPSFRTFCGLACGFVAQTGKRTVCGMLAGAGLARLWSHDRAHSFFSRARWDPDWWWRCWCRPGSRSPSRSTKLRRVIIAARFKASRPDQPTPEEISVLRLAWEDLAA